MSNIFEVALQPIIDKTMELRQTLKDYSIEDVFLVGGTSKSTWLWPSLDEAFGDTNIYVPDQTIRYVNNLKEKLCLTLRSTLVAKGATLAWSPDCFTKSRFSSVHLGHLVSKPHSMLYQDSSIWGGSKLDDKSRKVIEVVEVIKKKARSGDLCESIS